MPLYTQNNPLAIIGGSSLAALPNLMVHKRRVMQTPFGEPSSFLSYGTIGDQHIVYLARNGFHQSIPPYAVNHSANIHALHENGVAAIISIASAISLSDQIATGDFFVPDQLIDLSPPNVELFPPCPDKRYRPLDFSDPFSPSQRQALINATPKQTRCHVDGTYITTYGARSETKAEARYYQSINGMAIGAYGSQEAALAKAAGIPFALLSIVIRRAAGLPALDQDKPIEFSVVASQVSQWIAAFSKS